MPQQAQTLILIVLMVVAFYFLIMRPQRKRQQAIQQTMSELGPGSRVLLNSGVFGTVITVGDRQATVEIAPGVEMTILKQAIARVATEADEDTDPRRRLDDELEEADEPDGLVDADRARRVRARVRATGLELSICRPAGSTAEPDRPAETDRDQNRPPAN